jgi:hypothetical protein
MEGTETCGCSTGMKMSLIAFIQRVGEESTAMLADFDEK